MERPVSENQVDLITDTPRGILKENRNTGANKDDANNLLKPNCWNGCANVSETSSLIIKGSLWAPNSREHIEMKEVKEIKKGIIEERTQVLWL